MPDPLTTFNLLAALGASALILFVAKSCGGLALRLANVRTDCFLEQILYAYAIGLGLIGYLGALAGALGSLAPGLLWTVLGVLGVAGAGHLMSMRSEWPSAVKLAEGIRSERVVLVMSGVLLLVIVINAGRAVAPVMHDDSMTYHFGVPMRYLAEGGFHYIPGSLYANWQYLSQFINLVALELGGYAAAQLVHYAIFILCLLTVFMMTRGRYGARSGILAASIFGALNASKMLAGTGSDMFLLTFMSLLALHAVLRWHGDGTRSWIILACLTTGLTAGSKSYGLTIAFALGLLFIVAARKRWSLGTAARNVLIYGLLSIAVASPGYIKNGVLTGNPVFPWMSGTIPTRGWTVEIEAEFQGYHANYGNRSVSLEDGMKLPYRAFFWRSAILLWLFPLVFFIRRLHPSSRWMLVYIGLLILFWFIITQQSRLLMPMHAVVAVLTAGALGQWLRGQNVERTVIIALCLIASADLAVRNLKPGLHGWRSLAGAEARWEVLLDESPDMAIWRENREQLKDDRIYSYNDGRVFYFPGQWSRDDFYHVFREFSSMEQLKAHFDARGVTALFVNNHRGIIPGREAMERFIARYGRRITSKWGAYLYDLTGTRGEPAPYCDWLTDRVRVTASSNSAQAAAVVDGRDHRREFRDGGGWQAASAVDPGEPAWVDLAFEQPVHLTAVQVVGYPDLEKTLRSFAVIGVGTDGTDQVLARVVAESGASEWTFDALDAVVSRIHIQITDANGPPRILEIRAAVQLQED
jgi:hypothetical protein